MHLWDIWDYGDSWDRCIYRVFLLPLPPGSSNMNPVFLLLSPTFGPLSLFSPTLMRSKTKLGILGGGQLGRMLIMEAIPFDLHISVLDPDPDAPCATLADRFVIGDFADEEQVIAFGKGLDVLTVEIEHVSVAALRSLQASGLRVYPDPGVLEIIQDKGLQKQFYARHAIPTAPFQLIDSAEIPALLRDKTMVQKLRRGGYDGKGVLIVEPATPESQLLQGPSVLEEKADIYKEIAVIAARNPSGEIATFPAVEMVFDPRANLLDFLLCPAHISPETEISARAIAASLVEKLEHVGVLAVELFLCTDGSLWVNEMAPRPHNSGHQSLECNITSQYAQHLRAILDLPLGATGILRPGIMLNLLGEPGESGIAEYLGLEEAYRIPGAYVHLYGKRYTKPYRKMGHITVTAEASEDAVMKGLALKDSIRIVAARE